jgi:hypothetical protein
MVGVEDGLGALAADRGVVVAAGFVVPVGLHEGDPRVGLVRFELSPGEVLVAGHHEIGG